MLVCVIGWIFDVSVTITICTCRVRRQKARVDKRQKKYAKFLAKWYFRTYVSEGESAAKAKEVIEAVIWFIGTFPRCGTRRCFYEGIHSCHCMCLCMCSVVQSVDLYADIRGKSLLVMGS